ncbi:hypothetical protein [Staphylococcus carnosus]|uniref:Uncharacterized protein n=1 Tax=Staphylococcus carnosus (strain TM300) TaxID=396513 RepID=B9DJI5_STACT|nr:hypothetical protein [Staphylococcus carnosus]QPT03529.1 hypothetical protein I6G40_10665 [Staphylococcus carnosus]UQA66252.1 hypothetical protein Sta3580_06700 [Staphylococcus carnosus]UTB78910.1 hypothetical protein A2I62_10215 [Staphylococcus carnosus]UTB88463.1 hypothetical protein A2I63_10215 [Staphylococcus carnosus]UTB90811.1 hypothetical protein A2I64_10210 [Staphylococcus carnosus]
MGLFDNINLETEYLRSLSVKKRKAYKEKPVSVKKELLNQFKYETETFNNKASHDIIKRFLESKGIYEPTEKMISAIGNRELDNFIYQSPSPNTSETPSSTHEKEDKINWQNEKIIKQNEEIIHQNKKIIKLLTKIHEKS